MAHDLNAEAIESWDVNATFWDKRMGTTGNKWYNKLEIPVLEKLARVDPGTHALDLATGNGLVARWLAAQGAQVIATDVSPKMIEIAEGYQTNTERGSPRITYKLLDLSSADGVAWKDILIAAEKVGGFEIVTMNMAAMDISTLQPLATMLPKLLRPGGRFVANTLHPVFHTTSGSREIELRINEENGMTEPVYTFSLTHYMNKPPARGVAIEGQPKLQIYYHRPLHELFRPFFQAGLLLDALEEPTFSAPDEQQKMRLDADENFREMPPIMGFRMRRLN
ncbi:S-adenosyl-L-methionine-dependent methyltransferase [Aspergillus alliaceus]|uniref:S-adenosyl-L-methionine-dependent methyltransferase n=1 Tax=Petromyces alliaceus TaxID=209559 RepID=A0A5N7BX09_PETAA|nr:S-adenosyl-L-methionine-dependent methyltransferase [Aspergillus alliaceus]